MGSWEDEYSKSIGPDRSGPAAPDPEFERAQRDRKRFSDKDRKTARDFVRAHVEKHSDIIPTIEIVGGDGDARLVVGRVVPAPGHPSPHAAHDKIEEWDMRVKDDSAPPYANAPEKKEMMPNHRGEGDARQPPNRPYRDDRDEVLEAERPEVYHRVMEEGCVQEGWPAPHDGSPDSLDFPEQTPLSTPRLPSVKETNNMGEGERYLREMEPGERLGQGRDGGGFRMDAGKNRIELLPPEWLWALADVMTQGSKKYPARNWEQGMDWSSMIGCMYRHIAKFQAGQRYDGKKFDKKLGTTGCHEMAMVAWNALALLVYDLRGIGNNNLPHEDYAQLDLFRRVNAETSDLAARIAEEDDHEV